MPRRKCWIDGCQDASDRLGMCGNHADRWDVLVRDFPLVRVQGRGDRARFEFYTEKNPSEEVQKEFGAKPDCWVWRGALNHHGYGLFNSKLSKDLGIGQQVHLFTLNEYAEIDTRNDLHTDHQCRFRPCSNPDHLKRMTRKENILLGIGFAGVNARKGKCDNGHEFTPDNTRIRSNGDRTCIECANQSVREYQSRPEVKEARYEKFEPSTGVRGKGQYQKQRDECSEGHKLEGDNLIQEKRTRGDKVSYVRRCRTCVNSKARSNHGKRTGER